MPEIKMRDGTILNVPDDAPPEMLQRIAKANAAMEAPEPPSRMEKAGEWLEENTPDKVKLLGSSALKGVLGLPALAADILTAKPPGLKEAQLEALQNRANSQIPGMGLSEGEAKKLEVLKSGGDVERPPLENTKFSQAVQGSMYQPKTVGERYMDQAAQGASGGLLFPGSIARNALVGAASGLGGEAAGQFTIKDRNDPNDTGNPWARLVGALLTGGSATALSSFAGTKADLAKKLVENLTPKDVRTGTLNMLKGKAEGLPITASQALPDQEDLAAMAKYLAGHEAGKEIKTVLRNQPENILGGTRERIELLPGQAKSSLVEANDLQKQATDAFKALKQERSALVNPLYEATGDLGLVNNQSLRDSIKTMLKDPNLDIETGRRLQQLRAELATSSTTGKPRTTALSIKNAIDDILNTKTAQGVAPLNSKTVGSIKKMKADLYDELAENARNLGQPELEQANAVFGQFTRDKIVPFQESISGKIMGRQGALEGRNAAEGPVNSLFKGEDPYAMGSNIKTLAKDLESTSPMAVPDAFKSHLSSALSNVKDKGSPATQIVDNLWGSEAAKTATNRGLQVMEKSQGLPSGTLVKGFQRWMGLIENVAKSNAKASGITAEELAQTGGANAVSRGLGVFTIAPFAGPREAVSKLYLNTALRDIDKLFTDPNGLKLLVELSKKSTSNKVAEGLTATFLQTAREGKKSLLEKAPEEQDN